MSSDNYLYIDKKTFEVWSCMASRRWVGKKKKWTPKDQRISLVGKGKSLEEAIVIAEKYTKELEEDGCYVEYGISFHLWWK